MNDGDTSTREIHTSHDLHTQKGTPVQGGSTSHISRSTYTERDTSTRGIHTSHDLHTQKGTPVQGGSTHLTIYIHRKGHQYKGDPHISRSTYTERDTSTRGIHKPHLTIYIHRKGHQYKGDPQATSHDLHTQKGTPVQGGSTSHISRSTYTERDTSTRGIHKPHLTIYIHRKGHQYKGDPQATSHDLHTQKGTPVQGGSTSHISRSTYTERDTSTRGIHKPHLTIYIHRKGHQYKGDPQATSHDLHTQKGTPVQGRSTSHISRSTYTERDTSTRGIHKPHLTIYIHIKGHQYKGDPHISRSTYTERDTSTRGIHKPHLTIYIHRKGHQYKGDPQATSHDLHTQKGTPVQGGSTSHISRSTYTERDTSTREIHKPHLTIYIHRKVALSNCGRRKKSLLVRMWLYVIHQKHSLFVGRSTLLI